MGGNRNHGYARGNRSGRNGRTHPEKWFCCGCQRTHGGQVFKTTSYGVNSCDRHANRLEEARHRRRTDMILTFAQLP